MDRRLLETILQRAGQLRIVVLGDFFLDQYLLVDPKRREVSRETGKWAHQVVGAWSSPGAAGTVASNLRSLGVHVEAVGAIGDDGNGYQLRQELGARGVHRSSLLVDPSLVTPTYIKPMERHQTGMDEMERWDIKNYRPTSAQLEQTIIHELERQWDAADGIMVMDQVEEENCGTVTRTVRHWLNQKAASFPDKPVLVDSRGFIGRFRNVILKPNEHEARAAVGDDGGLGVEQLIEALYAKSRRALFVTRGPRGLAVFDGQQTRTVAAVPVTGPLDIVGAGDSTSAGILTALCANCSPVDAACFASLVASVTIQKLGTTGTATPEELRQQWQEFGPTLLELWSSNSLTARADADGH